MPSEPIRRNLLIDLAECPRIVHGKAVAVNVKLARSMAQSGPIRGGAVPDEEWKQLLAGIDRLTALARQVERSRQQ